MGIRDVGGNELVSGEAVCIERLVARMSLADDLTATLSMTEEDSMSCIDEAAMTVRIVVAVMVLLLVDLLGTPFEVADVEILADCPTALCVVA